MLLYNKTAWVFFGASLKEKKKNPILKIRNWRDKEEEKKRQENKKEGCYCNFFVGSKLFLWDPKPRLGSEKADLDTSERIQNSYMALGPFPENRYLFSFFV